MDAAPLDAAADADASTGYVFEPYESDEDRAEDRRSEKRLKGPAEPPWLFRGGAPKGFRAAQVVFWREEGPRRAGKFHQQFRKCWESGGVLDGRALVVTDDNRRLRAYFEETGSEDSAGTLRYFYDAHGRLRLLFVESANVDHGSYQWAVALDSRGSMLGCRMRTLHTGGGPGNLCEDDVEEPSRPSVASSVRGAVRVPAPKKRKVTPNKWRSELLAEGAQPLDKRCPPP